MKEPVQNAVYRWRCWGNSGRFWLLQTLGWCGLSLISYFSLNLWYNQPDLAYVGHNISQSLLGMLLSWPMRGIFRAIWDAPALRRGILTAATVLLFSGLWAALRLILFQMMTDESGLWADFGGWLFASIFIFLCWTALYHGIKYYLVAERKDADLLRMVAARNEAAIKAAQAESAARESQLEMLRYQLNPHFLFNTLNAIQSLVTSRQTERATRMIGSLSDFLRYSLYGGAQGEVTVAKEIEVLQRYLEIEQARFGDRLSVRMAVADDAREELIPCMLLQPLMENAIKYAVAPSEDAAEIGISAYCEGRYLCLEVIDSGVDQEHVSNLGPEGLGLRNIRQRLASHYGDDQVMTLEPRPEGGMCASVWVPRSSMAQTV